MHRRSRPRAVLIAVLVLGRCLLATGANAQQLIIKSEYGLMAGTQAPPGLHAGMLGYCSWADDLKDRNGNEVPVETSLLQGALTIRYFWQFGGKFSTQGQGLLVQFAMPF